VHAAFGAGTASFLSIVWFVNKGDMYACVLGIFSYVCMHVCMYIIYYIMYVCGCENLWSSVVKHLDMNTEYSAVQAKTA
jgi:hypothetical protein